jgi:hypothetical protein
MVRTFMEGIDPDYAAAIFKSFSDIVLALPGIIADDLDGWSDQERSKAVKRYKQCWPPFAGKIPGGPGHI